MTIRRASLGLLATALLTSNCKREPPREPDIDVAAARSAYAKQLATSPEALTWLRANRHPAALASNRFDLTQDAIAFVQDLYARGAARVVVVNIRPEEDAEYADAILIALPEEADTRASFLEAMKEEAARDGYVLGPEVKDDMLYMWWD